MKHQGLAAFILMLAGAGSTAVVADYTGISTQRIPVCYNFGCTVQQVVRITPEEWNEVANWFTPQAENAAQERKQIQHAVGWLEVVAGRYTPIHRDKGQNKISDTFEGQMDCIDESTNTTVFLHLLQNYGLLRFHRVVDRAYRRTLWDQHWAGQIEELDSGHRWVVDSWFQDFGVLPYIQEAVQWKDIPFFFTSYVDNSPD